MKLEHHIALSTIVSGILFALFKSWGLSISSLISGIFIDVDHAVDYITVPGLRIHPREAFHFFYKEKHRKITLLFHGWEWLIVLSIIAKLTDFNPWVTGMLIGYVHHIVSDYFYSKASVLTYSLVWRWQKKFDSHVLFPRDRGYDPEV